MATPNGGINAGGLIGGFLDAPYPGKVTITNCTNSGLISSTSGPDDSTADAMIGFKSGAQPTVESTNFVNTGIIGDESLADKKDGDETVDETTEDEIETKDTETKDTETKDTETIDTETEDPGTKGGLNLTPQTMIYMAVVGVIVLGGGIAALIIGTRRKKTKKR
jgi:hypothetical protein